MNNLIQTILKAETKIERAEIKISIENNCTGHVTLSLNTRPNDDRYHKGISSTMNFYLNPKIQKIIMDECVKMVKEQFKV